MTRVFITRWYEHHPIKFVYLNFLSDTNYHYISFFEPGKIEYGDTETAVRWRNECPICPDLFWWEE